MPPPLYEFRVEDMEPDHRVLLECACGHKGYLTKDELLKHPRIEPYHKILGLNFYVRCALCRKRGRVKILLVRFAAF